jgi:hypothetical protein
MESIQKLCSPAHIYFLMSALALVIMGIQNLGNVNKYCVGNFTCNVSNTLGVFVVKMLYIMFWTWVLNTLCKAGYKNISWALLLMPFIAMFILIALMFIH